VLIPLNTLSFAQDASAADLPSVSFTAPDPESALNNTTGHIDLVWAPQTEDVEKALQYELISAETATFEDSLTHYAGHDTRSFLSGLEGRTYFFKVRATDGANATGPWSEPLKVEVQYVSRSRVHSFMWVGAICLIATITIIVGGSLRTRNSQQTTS